MRVRCKADHKESPDNATSSYSKGEENGRERKWILAGGSRGKDGPGFLARLSHYSPIHLSERHISEKHRKGLHHCGHLEKKSR